MQLDVPATDELELSIFGPGYGEAVVLHIGNGNWILVDSCSESHSRIPASLRYLTHIGVAVESAVKLVIVTHWHDDHIRGVSALVERCEAAKLVISDAIASQEFLKLLSLYKSRVRPEISGIDEFIQVFRILDQRKQQGDRFNPPIFASSNKLLYRSSISLTNSTTEAEIYSLSPSDASKLGATLAFAKLLPVERGQVKGVVSSTPNHASVVLWVRVGDHRLLLGADLESTRDSKTGWSAILDDRLAISGEAGVFKVAHHGAESGHEHRVWSELLSETPFAVLSPFCKGNKILPTTSDISRIASLTPNAYITSRPTPRQHKWDNKIVRKTLKEATRSFHDVHQSSGHIRLRQRIEQQDNSWQVQLFGDAIALKV
jgi:hypothetical protein